MYRPSRSLTKTAELEPSRIARSLPLAPPELRLGLRPAGSLLHERQLGALPDGDVLEEDREAARRGVDPVLEPAVPGRVVVLELHEHLLGDGPVVRLVEGLADALRELGPDVLADEVLRAAAEELAGPLVDVHVVPVGVERHEGVGDALEDLLEPLRDRRGRDAHAGPVSAPTSSRSSSSRATTIGFGEVLADAKVVQPRGRPRGVVTCDHDHLEVARPRILAQPPQDLDSRHVGEVQVQQDQVRAALARELERRVAVRRREQARSRPARHDPFDQPRVERVVLDLENGEADLAPAHLPLGRDDRGRDLVPELAGPRHIGAASQRVLELRRQRREIGEADRAGRALQGVRLANRRRGRNTSRGGRVGFLQRVEAKPDPGGALRRLEQERRSQLAQVVLVERVQRTACSCAAATASARRDTPSFSYVRESNVLTVSSPTARSAAI